MHNINSTHHKGGRWRRLLAALLLPVGLVFGLAACAPAADGGGDASGDLQGKTIALVGYGDSNPWAAKWNVVFKGLVEPSGVEVQDFTTMDPAVQVQNFNQAIAENPSVIVTALLDANSMIAPVNRAIEAGIPVIVFDGKAPEEIADKIAGAVQTDNTAAGKLAAEGMIEGLRAQGLTSGNVVVITGTKAMGLTQDREAAFLAEMESSAPEFTVVANEDGNWDPTLTSTIASQLFAKFGPDGVQGAYGMADYMAIPIAQAAAQLGIPVGGSDGLIVTASNCSVAGLEAIRAGELYSSVDQDPQTIATETANYVMAFLKGEDVPKVLMVEMSAINASNVDDFVDQCNY